MAGLACAVLLVDHRRTLRALEIPRMTAAGRLLRLIALVDRRVLGAPLTAYAAG